jgi:hypothetical protein
VPPGGWMQNSFPLLEARWEGSGLGAWGRFGSSGEVGWIRVPVEGRFWGGSIVNCNK